jgi:hypothetical protein
MKARLLRRIQMIGYAPTLTRWQRRLTVIACLVTAGMFYLMATLGLYLWRDYGHGLYGAGSFIDCLCAIGLGLYLLRNARRNSVNLEDRAQMQYGKAFGELTPMQRDRVSWAWARRFRNPGNNADERDAAMQRDAEAKAFRMLRFGLPVLAALYWVVCLCAPIGPVRLGLMISAVAVSIGVFVILALPEVIWMWTMSDDPVEPKLVAMEREV